MSTANLSVPPGQIVILNGVPRSGKSSIAHAIQEQSDDVWLNLGVDRYMPCFPARYQPAIGLRPGGERPDLEDHIPIWYRALYDSVASHSRLGLNVVMDVGHHDFYRRPLGILADCAKRIADLPVLVVGVHCPIEAVTERRRVCGMTTDQGPIERWQSAVHRGLAYDIDIDTSALSPVECGGIILSRLTKGPSGTAIHRLADM